jgi:photosystem II stability/assembly factor-like uncharacterized protein
MTPSSERTRSTVWRASALAALLAGLLLPAPARGQGGGWQVQNLPPLPSGQSYGINAVSATDATHVWVAGSIAPSGDDFMARSENGGATWTLVHREAGLGSVNRIKMLTNDVGFIAGNFDLFRSTNDGGTTWIQERNSLCCPPPNPPDIHNVGPGGHIYGLAVADSGHIWTCGWDGYGAGVMYHRKPERPQPSPPTNPNQPWWLEWAMNYTGMYGMAAADASTAWAVGWAGNIWKTTDGGDGWGPQTSNTGASLNDVAAISTSTAWAVGDSGTILKTTDGGTTWNVQTSDTTENLRRIAVADAATAWVVGTNGLILRTTNGGTTWVRQYSGTRVTFTGVAAVSATTAWAVGENNTLLATTDGGAGAWAAPTITSITPSLVGPQSYPPMTVTITGTGLRGGGVAVLFGTESSSNVTWVDTTTLRAVAAPNTPGAYSVTVTNEDGQSVTVPAAVTYMPLPVTTGYSPLHGPATGGYQITVDGFNLLHVTSAQLYIQFTSAPYELYEQVPVNVVGSTRVLVSVPVSATRPVGKAFIMLKTSENQEAYGNHFVLDPPGGPTFAIDTITPRQGTSGTTVTVTGVGFSDTAYLSICADDLVMTSRSATQLVGTTRGSNSGRCNVRVQNDTSTSIEVDPGFMWSELSAPTITQVTPAWGPPSGGSAVIIVGTGLAQSYSTEVSFDGYPAVVTSKTNTRLVVTSPPHPLGQVSIFVMPSDGSGRPTGPVAVATNAFTYAVGPPAPTMTGVAPATGPAIGGTTVTLTGTGFLSGATVKFDTTAATDVVVASATSITATTPAHAPGVVNVTVTNTDAQSAIKTGAFTYVAAPTLTTVAPASGSTVGGTAVTLTGTGFLAGATVALGGTAATGVAVGSATTITATAPSHAAGAVDVVVTNPDAQSATKASAFTYYAPPTLTAVSPASGPTAGGTAVTLTGTGLRAGATVALGGTAATSVVVMSATSITATAPAHAAGVVDVVVSNSDSQSSTLAGGFTYVAAPTLTTVTPASGTTAGGVAFTLTGTGFRAGIVVMVGGVPATSVVVVSATSISAVTPPHAAGPVSVTLTNSDGQAATLANGFTYVAPPLEVTSLYPGTGTVAGGTLLSIGGAGFLPGSSSPFVAAASAVPTVTVGGLEANNVTVVSDMLITALSPALPANTTGVDVVVTFAGASPMTMGHGFKAMDPAAMSGTDDQDGDSMPSVWELRYSLDPLVAADAAGDPDGDASKNAQEYAAGTHPRGLVTRYLAEGATSDFFETRLALANLTDAAEQVLLRFQRGDGTTVGLPLTVGAHSRSTVEANAVTGMAKAEFSTVLESDGAILVDRTMTWSRASGYGAHAEHGLLSPALTWYLAEGATHSGFDLFYLLQNPNERDAEVRVRFLLPAPQAPLDRAYTVAPRSRFNIWVNWVESPADSGNCPLASTDVSAVIQVTNGQPIIVERAMYLSGHGQSFDAGHESAGVTAPATRWFLAEGATGALFDLFVLIANPGDEDAVVRLTYLLPDGTQYTRTTGAAANSRTNVWVDLETPDGTTGKPLENTAVSTTVESLNDVPIIVERAMWWPGTGSGWYEAHNSPGSTETGVAWGLAEGEVGGPRGQSTYVLIANTSAFDGRARVTLYFEDGSTTSRTVDLTARSRTNIDVGAPGEFGGFGAAAQNKRFAILVESVDAGGGLAELVVERAMYADAGGVAWAAGTNALATKLR